MFVRVQRLLTKARMHLSSAAVVADAESALGDVSTVLKLAGASYCFFRFGFNLTMVQKNVFDSLTPVLRSSQRSHVFKYSVLDLL